MRSARTSSRSRKTLLFALAAFALTQVALAGVVLSDPTMVREDLTQRRLRRYQQRADAQPGALTVVQIGSSRTEFGLCGTAAEPWLSQRLGQPVVLFNMGAQGAGPAANLVNLRRRLNDGVRPNVLLLEVLPALLDEREMLTDLDPLRMPASGLRCSEVALVWQMAGRTRPWLWAEWVKEQALAAETHRLALLSQGCPRLLSPENRRDGFRSADECGYIPPTKRTPEQLQKALQHARERYQPVLATFRLSQKALDVIGETVEAARSEGMTVALVLMPEGPAFRSWYPPGTWSDVSAALEKLSQKHQTSLIDLREALDEEDLFDSHHATHEGARKLTGKLARRIEPLLRAAAQQQAVAP